MANSTRSAPRAESRPAVIAFPTAARAAQLRGKRAEGARRPGRSPGVGSNVVLPPDADPDATRAAVVAAEREQSHAISEAAKVHGDSWAERYVEVRDRHPDTVVWRDGQVVAIVRGSYARYVWRLWGHLD